LIGGLTSAGGAFVAGILLGIAEAVIRFKSPDIGVDVGLEQAVLAVFIIAMLLVRPNGLVRSRY
jgi:branched-subunit amino acid ABC-type transport system permease component